MKISDQVMGCVEKKDEGLMKNFREKYSEI